MNKNNHDLIYSGASPDKVAEDLRVFVDFQAEGLSIEQLSKLINEQLIPHFVQYDRPEFQSLYNFFPEEGAEFGAKIALQFNQGVTNWQVSPGGVMLEELCCKALCQLFGFAPSSDATFMYCGTYANQQALYLALHRKAEQYGFNLAHEGLTGFKDPDSLTIITSAEAHFSLKHAVRIMGLGEQCLVTVPVDDNYRMDINAFKETIQRLQKRKNIFCAVLTAGTTSTGSIDPIFSTVEICEEIGVWSHIDGAYGLAFSLLPECKHLFTGIEHADSVSWDPHKQFGVPIPNSILFVRRCDDFERMAIYGDYFNRKDDPEPNPGLKSPPSTRPFSALPLVTSIRHQGMNKVLERLRTPLQTIKTTADRIRAEADIELCHQPDTGILCLRIIPKDFPTEQTDNLQRYIYNRIKTEGKRSISLTRLKNKTALRLLAISPFVSSEALMETIEHARALASEYKASDKKD